jgi:hypothetical protein
MKYHLRENQKIAETLQQTFLRRKIKTMWEDFLQKRQR